MVGDLTDAEAVSAAVAGMDAVIHLGGTPDSAPFVSDLMPNNVGGTDNVLAACVEHGVKRAIIASTLRTMSSYRKQGEIAATHLTQRPHDHYSASKVMVEILGELYARTQGLEVIAVRLAAFSRDRENFQRSFKRSNHEWFLSHDDAVRFFRAALTADHTGYAVFNVCSRDGAEVWDVAPAKAIGYVPEDSWPEGMPEEWRA